jgi:ribosome-binding factor A
MNVDATTAKVFLEVYNKQKSQKQNQIVEKIQTKSGFLSMLEMMYKKIG